MSVLNSYKDHLSRLPLSPHTRRNYIARVKSFLDWISSLPEASGALSDEIEMHLVVREYKQHLLQSGSTSQTVNAALTAIDNFYLYLGMHPAKARRQELPKLAPRALSAEELRRFLKSVLQSGSLRNRALVSIMLNCGLRISEVAALDAGDIVLTARKRELVVRCGKNSKRRTVPINKDCAEVLQQYLQTEKFADPNSPLFVSRKGFRLSQPAIDHLVRKLGKDAGVEVSSHRLRHCCLTRLVRAGIDIVAVAEIAGHSRLETTRRYSLPSAEVMISAMEKLNHAS